MRSPILAGLIGCLFLGQAAALKAAQPLTIFILDFDSNIAGENRSVAQDMAAAVETAFAKRHDAFKLLERRTMNEIVDRGKMEQDYQALARGQKPSAQFLEKDQCADGVLRGELNETRLDGVVLTVSLTRLDSEKLWQAQRKHTLYEWLSGEVREREAESLAAEAEAALRPHTEALPVPEDGPRGLALAVAGKCREALPLLENAAAVDGANAEYYLAMGRCQNQSGEFGAASRSLTYAISRNPRRAELFVERAKSFVGEALSSRALEDLDQAQRLDPGNLLAIELRGDVLLSVGKYDGAVDAFYAAYQQKPTGDLCTKLVRAYEKNGASGAAATLRRSCATAR